MAARFLSRRVAQRLAWRAWVEARALEQRARRQRLQRALLLWRQRAQSRLRLAANHAKLTARRRARGLQLGVRALHAAGRQRKTTRDAVNTLQPDNRDVMFPSTRSLHGRSAAHRE